MNTLLKERIEQCQACNTKFNTDSPYNDKYCGDCRVYWYSLLKILRAK